MKAIPCNTDTVFDFLMNESDAKAVKTCSVWELWRVELNDAVAVAFKGKVLPQGRNPKRISDFIASHPQTSISSDNWQF